MGVSFLYHTALDPGLEAGRTECRAASPGPVEVLQIPRTAVNADSRPDPGRVARPILGPPLAQQDVLGVKGWHGLQRYFAFGNSPFST